MDGIINILKPPGMTSHDVVGFLRGVLKTKKIGHTGTLDPDAAGVLPICVGKATKVVDYLTDKRKRYRAELVLGTKTDTQDSSGKIISQKPVNVSKDQLNEAINTFIGKIKQIPPMYSAVKIGGKKLYELARKGIEIERAEREVEIYVIEPLNYDGNVAVIDIECSKGTYIRTLCRDIGDKLGCGAHMGFLLRLQSGIFDISSSLTLDEVIQGVENGTTDFIKPVDYIFNEIPKVTVKDESIKWVQNGAQIYLKDILGDLSEKPKLVRVYDSTEEFLAIYKTVYDENVKLIADKMFI